MLHLDNTNVDDLAPIKGLLGLQRLGLSDTTVSDLTPIKGFFGLQTLNLNRTKISDLTALSNIPSLRELYIGSTQVSDLQPLERMQNLLTLDLSYTQIIDLKPIENSNRLVMLILTGTPTTDLAPLEGAQILQTLVLDGTQVSDLMPIASMRAMAIWAIDIEAKPRFARGLCIQNCPNLPKPYQSISKIEDAKERTLAALNQIRKDAGMNSVGEWLAGDEIDRPPEKPSIPAQEDGLSFETTERGRIGLVSSGQPSPDDVDEIEGIKPTLIAAVDALEAACEGSNAFQHFKPVATRYRAALEGEITQLSIDRLVAEGTWLGNANMRLQKEIASGDLPEQGTEIGAAMDTVIALHGMSVMGTTRGRELIQRGLDYQMDIADIEEAKARTSEFAKRVREDSQLFEPEVGEIVERASSEINEGPHPDRSTDTARGIQSNMLRVLGYTIMTGAVWPVVSSGVSSSQLGIAASSEITLVMDAARAFWLSNQTIVLKMAAAWGTDLNWVQALYRWLGTNHTITKDED